MKASSFPTLQRGLVTLALTTLAGCMYSQGGDGDEGEPRVAAAPTPGQPSVAKAREPETCNGLDDNGDGARDEGQACAAVCSSAALEKAKQSIRLPHEGDITVPTGSTETPTLLAIQQIPDFCLGATPPSTRDDVTVACGEVFDVDRLGINATTLRVAPGGVVRIKESAILALRDEILVCPGAVIESGADVVDEGNGRDGADVELTAERLIMLGKIATRGGWVPTTGTGQPGRSGRLQLAVDRLLFSGVIDTNEVPPRGYRSGEAGDISIYVAKESFFSGGVRSGNAFVKLPVCCH